MDPIPESGRIEAEGPSSWLWIAQIPPVTGIQRFAKSPTFRYQDTEWFLRCSESWGGLIRLWLYPKSWPLRPLAPFAVSVRLPGMASDSRGLIKSAAVEPVIWRRMASEVERISYGFRSLRLLTFSIDFKEQDPQRGRNSARTTAPHCPQPEMHIKIFADASVQTSLTTAVSISCLDALSEDFSKMLDAHSDCDVEIHCHGHSTRAHRSVLCSRSPVLAKMLHSDMVEGRTAEVNIREIDADTFRRFLLYLYTGKLDDDALTCESAMSLYETGDMYGVLSLKTFCSDFLRANLTLDNASEVLAVADAHADANLAEAVNAYILESKIQWRRQWRRKWHRQWQQEAKTAFSPLRIRRETPDSPFSINQVLNGSDPASASAQLFELAYLCPQPEMHLKTFAAASVQTSLTTNTISSLDALSEDFSKMLDADSDLDVELHCQGYSTRAHKSVLCSRSPVLGRVLHSDMAEGRTGEINIRDLDVHTFRRFLLYLYTGKLDEDTLTFDSAMSLYEAGDMYGVMTLKDFCSDFLGSRLTFENAREVLAIADAHADTSCAEVWSPSSFWRKKFRRRVTSGQLSAKEAQSLP